MQDGLTEIQFQILDSIYFVEPFARILEEVEASTAIVADELRTLIDKGWVQVMAFDVKENDYLRTLYYDTDHMEEFAYLATKEGLLKHNGY